MTRTAKKTLFALIASVVVVCALGLWGAPALAAEDDVLVLNGQDDAIMVEEDVDDAFVETQGGIYEEPVALIGSGFSVNWEVNLINAEAVVPADVINAMLDLEDTPVSESTRTIDFNQDGTADAEFSWNKDSTCTLRRLDGADRLTQNYSYTFEQQEFKSITFKTVNRVTGISLNKSEISLTALSGETLTATVEPGYATRRGVKWTSYNTNVATVSSTGAVTTKSSGIAVIAAKTEDGDYLALCKVSVTKLGTKLTANNKTYKAKAKTKKYSCALKDANNNVIKNQKITLQVNGKTYTAKTSEKGKATFKIKISKKGKFAATIKYAGNGVYKAASKKAKITIK